MTDLAIVDIPNTIWAAKHTQFNDILELGKVFVSLGTTRTFFERNEMDVQFLKSYSRRRLVTKASLGELLTFSKIAIEYYTRMWNAIDALVKDDDYKRNSYRNKVFSEASNLVQAMVNSILEYEQNALRVVRGRAEKKYREAKRAKYDEKEKTATGKALRELVRKKRAWEAKAVPDNKLEYVHDNTKFAKYAVQLIQLWAEPLTLLWKKPFTADEFDHSVFIFFQGLVKSSFHPSQVDQLNTLMRPYFGVYTKLTQRWLDDYSYARSWNSHWSSGIKAITKSLVNMKENVRLPQATRAMADKSIETIIVQYFFPALKKVFPDFHMDLIVSLSTSIPELVSLLILFLTRLKHFLKYSIGSYALLGHVCQLQRERVHACKRAVPIPRNLQER